MTEMNVQAKCGGPKIIEGTAPLNNKEASFRQSIQRFSETLFAIDLVNFNYASRMLMSGFGTVALKIARDLNPGLDLDRLKEEARNIVFEALVLGAPSAREKAYTTGDALRESAGKLADKCIELIPASQPRSAA